ncbi:antitoxin Xre/MbcA/ParS toxin-binding domain-containing protein [Aeromonas caviae]|uniref:antitoxin Xre/MbcA/ParS toxin-binding domain-containing protein n=1 Tax=Aeromonas caviae TaxID=648 RepID=UPI002F3EB797
MNVGISYNPPKNLVGKPDDLLATLSLPKQPVDAHKETLAGFSYEIVKKLSIMTQIDEITICQLANISCVSFTKRKIQSKNVLSSEQSMRLYVFIRTLDATQQLFNGDVSTAIRWLKSPSRALGDESPIEMLSTPPGIEAVMDLIGQIKHGIIP